MSIVIIANHWNHWKTSKRTVWIIILYHISFRTITGCQLRSPDLQREIRNWGSVWRTSTWQNSGQKQEERSFWTQLNSPVVNVIWRLSVTLSRCVTAVKFGVWASVSTRARQTYVEGMEFLCTPCHLCADVGVPVGPSVAACRRTSCVHAVSATHIDLFSQRAQELESRGSEIGEVIQWASFVPICSVWEASDCQDTDGDRQAGLA